MTALSGGETSKFGVRCPVPAEAYCSLAGYTIPTRANHPSNSVLSHLSLKGCRESQSADWLSNGLNSAVVVYQSMRRCPECKRCYDDEALKFCRFDGVLLISDSSDISESDTTIDLSMPKASIETSVQMSAPTPSPSIAVLPFINMSADQENDYFCDGLAEEVLNALAHLDGLKVAARTSAFHFKGKDATIGEIGRALNVAMVLEGSVRKVGSRLRVTAQLVNVSDGYHLWSERYDRQLEDVFEIQDQITLTIVEALKLKLLGTGMTTPLKRHSVNSETYVAYLKGRYQLSKFTVESWTRAIEYFDEATLGDPEFAPAYAGAAMAWNGLWYYALKSPHEIVPRWKAAASRALELDDNLAEAHVSFANILFFYEWDWEAAEKSFSRAIELNQNSADAHWFYGIFLASRGRYDEAISEGRRALELDPLSVLANVQVGWIYWVANRMDDVLVQANKTLEIEPNSFGAYWLIGGAYLAKGMHDEAIEAYNKALSFGASNIVLSALARVYALAGRREEALEIVDKLLAMRAQRYVPAFDIARIYLGLGETELTLEWMEKSFEERNGELVSLDRLLKVESRQTSGKGIREDPRLSNLLQRMGCSNEHRLK
jgi:TolB-like protein/Flp pilus assembly protein TadD